MEPCCPLLRGCTKVRVYNRYKGTFRLSFVEVCPLSRGSIVNEGKMMRVRVPLLENHYYNLQLYRC